MHEDQPQQPASEGPPSDREDALPSFAPVVPPATGGVARANARKSGTGRAVREFVVVVALAMVVALLLRAFVVQVYKIPSESMLDTLDVGSRIAVNHIPVLGTQVERGDVIVFRDSQGWLPASEEEPTVWATIASWFGFSPAGGEQVVVKRIIGVGGDTVACCDAEGRITVNGVAVDETYLADGAVPSVDEFSVTVPEGYYWVMGDNRQNSADSLYHYLRGEEAFVAADSVIGKAQWEIWPISRWSSLGNRGVFESVPDAEQ